MSKHSTTDPSPAAETTPERPPAKGRFGGYVIAIGMLIGLVVLIALNMHR